MRLRLSFLLLLLSLSISLYSQQNSKGEDRLVRLIKAKTAETYKNDYREQRRVTGSAQFLHNNALIICDTALWDVTYNIIDAIGNVRIIQDKTILTGDRIHYIADSSLAKVRGNLVELTDADSNRLRTHYLDYNTKDSIAYFYNGGSMMDKNGSVIESDYGYYHSKIERFKFIQNVQLSSDSLVLKSDSLAYWGGEKRVDFLGRVVVWQNEGFLSSETGWYNRESEIYNFENNAYMLTPDNEIRARRIYYEREVSMAELYDNVQILDTVQSVILFSDFVRYKDNPTFAELYKRPSIAYYSLEDGIPDTLFIAADTMLYSILPRYLADSATVAQSEKRYSMSLVDPIREMFNKPGAKPGDKAEKQSKNTPPVTAGKDSDSVAPPPADSIKTRTDNLLTTSVQDSIRKTPADSIRKTPADSIRAASAVSIRTASAVLTRTDLLDSNLTHTPDSLKTSPEALLRTPQIDSNLTHTPDSLKTLMPVIEKDTTQIRFISANRDIRFFRSDFQGRCDSLMFNSIDSIIRLYKKPVLWNDNNQFTGDSIQLIISESKLKKTELLSNAFVITKEDSLHYNQIKSADIVAHFTEGDLRRFDAFGGVNLIFFLAEDSILTTMNQKECKTMTADIKDRSLQRVKYFENLKSDIYPIIDLEPDKKQLRGFLLRFDERPATRYDVTDRRVIPSQRDYVMTQAMPQFPHTRLYFGTVPDRPKFSLFDKKEAEQPVADPPESVISSEIIEMN
jgi:lipopolysaccharide export system protein LptA